MDGLRGLRRAGWVVLAWFLGHTGFLFVDGFRAPELPADLAVVFGNKVERDGQPSSGLERRLERALDLYRRGAVKAILVSGGLGVEGYQEADVMRDVLVRNGVPPAVILVDGAGNNTRLTAIHARAILESRGWRSAVVVTQYYHVPRAKLALRQEGIEQVTGAAAEYRFSWKDPWSIVREWVGFYSYLLRR
jgi:vancomycin permeability regulator SanA